MKIQFEQKPYEEARIKAVLGLWSHVSYSFYWMSIMSMKPPKQLSLVCRLGILDQNLNDLTENYGEYDAILLTEWDHEYPPDTLEILWNSNKPVVSGLYRSRQQRYRPIMAGKELKDGGIEYNVRDVPDKLFQTDWTGLGCMLVRKEVFDVLKKPFFDPIKKGIDRDFCKKLKDAGLEIWINPKAQVGHLMSDVNWPVSVKK